MAPGSERPDSELTFTLAPPYGASRLNGLAAGPRLYPCGSFVYRLMFRQALPLFFAAQVDLRVRGRENIPRHGPLIVISNHVDNLDTYVLGAQFDRVVNYLARVSGLESRWLGLYWRLMAALPADRRGFGLAVSILRGDGAVGVFPEGVISPALVRAKPGVALMALRSGAPVLPCAVWGTERVGCGPRQLLRRQRVYLRIGPPCVLHRGQGRAQELTDSLMREIAGMLPPRYRGYYA